MEDLIGRVVVSKAGRDRGRRFAVIAIADDECVFIADGDSHKTGRPKKKKLRHLQFERARIKNIEALLSSPGGTADAALRRAIACVDHEDDI